MSDLFCPWGGVARVHSVMFNCCLSFLVLCSRSICICSIGMICTFGGIEQIYPSLSSGSFFGISILSKTTTKQSQFMHFYCKIFCQDLHTFPQMFQRRITDSVNVFAYWMFDPLLLVPSSFH